MRHLREVALCAVALLVLAAILFPVFAQSHGGKLPYCLSNLKQIVIGLITYADDADGLLPDRDHWIDATLKYTKNERIYHCSSAKIPYGYAFNAALDRARTDRIADPISTPMGYDSVAPIRNASDRFVSLPHPGRHGAGNYVVYADSHGRRVK